MKPHAGRCLQSARRGGRERSRAVARARGRRGQRRGVRWPPAGGHPAVCNLHHPRLLDAAHIIGDGKPLGQAIVPNGLSLCTIHHAAYDANLLGIDSDSRVHVNAALLEEVDGPMLRHGLQEMHGQTLRPPKKRVDRPDRERLEVRFEIFRRVG